MQTMYTVINGQTYRRLMPPSDTSLNSGITWGHFDELFTVAYWCGQVWQADLLGRYRDLRLGNTLVEETAACLLGGYGMKAELGLAAFRRLRDRGILDKKSPAEEIERHLSEPFRLGERALRYRFPRQKAIYLEGCLSGLSDVRESELEDVSLRETLLRLPGIGLKTASWIVRNVRKSRSVAVLDVHILRAGRMMGLFQAEETPQRDYRSLETRFVDFATEIEAPTWLLDAVMWQHMRLLQNA